ncbi:MAG: HAMP domain-containing protein, partial [Chloroflexi bacterium]
MSIELLLISGPPYIELPQSLVGWLGLFLLVTVQVVLLRRWWGMNRKKWGRLQWIIFIGLLVMLPLTSLVGVVRLPTGGALPPPGKPIDPIGPAWVVLSAVPWVLGAGTLGPGPAALLAISSGLFLSLFDTHNPFTPFELSFAALLLSACLHQRYRTFLFSLLRRPLLALTLLVFAYPLIYLTDTLFFVSGSLASRLDYGFSNVRFIWVAAGGAFLVAGVFAEAAAVALSELWGKRGPLVPAPPERKLETRFYFSLAPLMFLLIAGIMAGDWYVAGNSAREMLRERMASTAGIASDTLPFFLESGQSLIKQLAEDPRLYTLSDNELTAVLSQDLRSVPFFRQLFLIDDRSRSIAGYPSNDYETSFPPPEERVGIQYAFRGVPVQNYTIPEMEGDKAAQVSFLAAVRDEDGDVRRVLVGRSDLGSNPFTQPVLENIENMVGDDGEGMLIDNDGRIIYHTNPAHLMEIYTGQTAEEILFYDDAAPDGTRRLVYYQPVLGHPWSVVLSVPARRAQQMALNIAIPLLGIVLLLFFFATILLRYGLRFITSSLRNLSNEAKRISEGELDHELAPGGEDEIGQLRRSFEGMRLSLKSRLEELNRLLLVSQGVASSLEVSEAAQPVLEACLSLGAKSARIVLSEAAMPETNGDIPQPVKFGQGPSSEAFAYLDDQILNLARKQEQLVLNNITRVRLFTIPPGQPRPESLLGVALRHENLYYGVLWLGFDQHHKFSEDELRFVNTLGGQAALAAANTRLFQSSELGRQRLAAILASSPDPILVTDSQNRLLLSNPASWQVLGFGTETGSGLPIERITSQKELLRLLRSNSDDKQSAEVTLLDGKIYLATASSVNTDGQRMGRVCVLRDITHFKELDQLKSEFVATVSHDLRSPLTLMRGYATMLEMVGELNEQQVSYTRKIVTAVESMTRLVNNLLDLGRIDAGVDLQLEMVLVHDIVDRVVGAQQLQAAQKRITLASEIPSETIPLIEADQALLQQALHNLVENAIKYTDNGGKINVRVQTKAEGILFEVSDTGSGIAPVDLSRLFEKFYRGGQRETRKHSGTGLG